MSWKDIAAMIADIAIVFYVIYRVLLVLRGKRAAQGLIGLVIIVFQQDIRSFLIRMGRDFLGRPRVEEDDSVDAGPQTG